MGNEKEAQRDIGYIEMKGLFEKGNVIYFNYLNPDQINSDIKSAKEIIFSNVCAEGYSNVLVNGNCYQKDGYSNWVLNQINFSNQDKKSIVDKLKEPQFVEA
jgi:hypothetical protein